MPKILVLDASVFNRIAAGEVVERPASVVKELTENSIDAGANTVVIEIRRGGKESIKVSDNGCGISRDELTTAFLPHATSKIAAAEDLDGIATMGFRGEALASIAAVADVEMISKPARQELGARVRMAGGEAEVSDVGSPDGTYFTVSDLFGRVPARKKFLDSDRQEESAVTDCISRLILANPDISFRYLADGKKIYQSYGQGIRDALRCIYGAEALDQTIEIDVAQDGMRLRGFLGRESYSKSNRTYQTLIVNGRYVVNQTVSNAVFYAYADRLMKRQFPFYVLYLEMPLREVDVNVHPNKKEVRFVDREKIYQFVHLAVAHALASGYEIPKVESNAPNMRPAQFATDDRSVKFVSQNRPLPSPTPTAEFRQPSEIFVRMEELIRAESAAAKAEGEQQRFAMRDETVSERSARRETANADEECGQLSFPQSKEVRKVGVAFDTYLIVETESVLYFVDQHAAHERLLYDRFKAGADADCMIQDLLLPYVFTVNPDENEYLRRNLSEISALGIGIEEFGDCCYRIGSLPTILCDMNLKAFVGQILADPETTFAKSGGDLVREKLMQEACKAAVKGGDKLDDGELALIVGMIAETQATLLCPHGRPIAVKIPKETVEKWFKRIVS